MEFTFQVITGIKLKELRTEILNISSQGIWLFHDSKEYFLT